MLKGNKPEVWNTVGGVHISLSVPSHSIKFWLEMKCYQIHSISRQIIWTSLQFVLLEVRREIKKKKRILIFRFIALFQHWTDYFLPGWTILNFRNFTAYSFPPGRTRWTMKTSVLFFSYFLFLIIGYLKIKMSFALILVEYRGLNFLA